MTFKNPYLTPAEKISTLQRWILLHSYLYYKMDKSVVTDQTYDENSRQLSDLLWDYGNVKTRYSEVFKDFDGSTGFDLFQKCSPEIKQLIIQDSIILLEGRK